MYFSYTRVFCLSRCLQLEGPSIHARQAIKRRSAGLSCCAPRHHISKALPCRQRTPGFGTRRTTPCQAQGEGVGWEGTRVGAGGRSASVLVAGRGARAHAMHEGLVGLALAGLGPPLAALVVVVAHRRAHLRREEGHTSACACGLSARRGGAAASRWAALGAARRTPHESGHSFITARGLLMHSPASAQISHCVAFLSAHLTPSHTPQLLGHSLYLRGGTRAGVHARRVRAGRRRARWRWRDAHEAGVLEALAVGRPARAVGLDVLARSLAGLARHGARADHELGVGVALARGAPAGALLVRVLALGRAQPAAGRAEPKHRVGVLLALTSGGPRPAGGVRVVARVCADAAGQGALDRHEFLPARRRAAEWVAHGLGRLDSVSAPRCLPCTRYPGPSWCSRGACHCRCRRTRS